MNAKLVSNVVRCLCSVVFLVTCSTSARTEAASYEQTDGTIVDPILDRFGSTHPYSGNDLEPHADLTDANLYGAYLAQADLSDADLHYVDLGNANLTNVTLTDAILRNADLRAANLTDANLTGAYLINVILYGTDLYSANLTGVEYVETSFGSPYYYENTVLSGDFDPVAQGWTLAPYCDFTPDAACDVADINQMFEAGNLVTGVAVAGRYDRYNLSDNDTLNAADITEWLSQAATANGHSSPYLRGDTELDRDVDITTI